MMISRLVSTIGMKLLVMWRINHEWPLFIGSLEIRPMIAAGLVMINLAGPYSNCYSILGFYIVVKSHHMLQCGRNIRIVNLSIVTIQREYLRMAFAPPVFACLSAAFPSSNHQQNSSISSFHPKTAYALLHVLGLTQFFHSCNQTPYRRRGTFSTITDRHLINTNYHEFINSLSSISLEARYQNLLKMDCIPRHEP